MERIEGEEMKGEEGAAIGGEGSAGSEDEALGWEKYRPNVSWPPEAPFQVLKSMSPSLGLQYTLRARNTHTHNRPQL